MSGIMAIQILDTMASGGHKLCDSHIFDAFNDESLSHEERTRICNNWRRIKRGIDAIATHLQDSENLKDVARWIRDSLEEEPIKGEPI